MGDSLDQVRAQIDRLDRQIVALLAERGEYVRQAARFKKTSLRRARADYERRIGCRNGRPYFFAKGCERGVLSEDGGRMGNLKLG